MKKILIVDDCKDVRHLVSTTLDLKHFKIIEAHNGPKAIEMSLKHLPDCIIMDIIMPGPIDGLEALRRIKNDPKTAHCSIIILSGARSDRREECLNAGADEIIVKPFSPLKLISIVEKILEVPV